MLIEKLKENEDKNYLKFNQRIIKTNQKMIGVRVPILRKIAKEINLDDFLKEYKGVYYEETFIYGLLIGNLKDKELIKKHLILYSKEIKDWSQCDSPANNLKILKKNNEYFLSTIEELLSSTEEFEVRFGLVLLLFHYINDQYIDYILKVSISIKSDLYYINMALSWLLCECFIKYEEKTDIYISPKYLNNFVLNKTISKISDSYRVPYKVKLNLKKRKI